MRTAQFHKNSIMLSKSSIALAAAGVRLLDKSAEHTAAVYRHGLIY